MNNSRTEQKCSGGNTKAPVQRKKSSDKKFRNICFTLFHDSEHPPIFDEKNMKFLAYGSETCPNTGRHHWQSYCSFNNAKTWTAIQKYFGDGRHFECMLGSFKENETYCGKESHLICHGEKPDNQGKRVDLLEVKDQILSGKTVEEIMIESPILFHQYGRTMEKIEDYRLRNIFRTEMTEGLYLCGPTGCGKSHVAFAEFSPQTHYVFPNDGGWWDGYRQQPIVVFNEFRGEVSYNEMLDLCDKWPKSVKRRGREPMTFTSKLIIVTSPLPLEIVWGDRNSSRDNIEQMTRRFKQLTWSEVQKKFI